MRDNSNSAKEMKQFTAEYKTENQIIAEYKEMEGIDTISEDELLNLLGETYFNYNTYSLDRYRYGNHVYIVLSDYEQYQLDNGYDPITADFLNELLRIDYHNIPFYETVQPGDFENDNWWLWSSSTFGELLHQSLDEEGLVLYGNYRFPLL